MHNQRMKKPIEKFVDKCAEEYKAFTGIDEMPKYKTVPITLSVEKANQKGYGFFARQLYDVTTGNQTLQIWEDLYKPQLHGKYCLYHEFTHMLDAEKYSQRDKIKNVANKGFTEYHAAQIELLYLLGAENISDDISFSMEQEFETVPGKKNVLGYVQDILNTVKSLLTRPDFPADIETLATTLGMIFNYWGRLSVCKMYAEDYQKYADQFSNEAEIEQFFGTSIYNRLQKLMQGRLNDEQVALVDEIYLMTIIDKGQRMK